jgi:hypothetical protein
MLRIAFIMSILPSTSCIKQIILLQAREYKMHIIYLKKGVRSKLTQL